jgi:hypothetical protein
LAILAITASSVLWSLSTSFKKSLSSALSVLTICWNPALAKALTDPNLTPTQKQQLAKELVSGVMVELGYTLSLSALLALFCGLVSILGSWLSNARLVSSPREVAKSLVFLRLASLR